MANSINHVTLLGYIGGVNAIKTITKLRLATSRATKDGESWVDVTDWHNVVTFQRTAEYCRDNVRKGDRVCVTGKLVTSSYERHGITVYTTEIHAREVIQLTKRAPIDNGDGDGEADELDALDDIPF